MDHKEIFEKAAPYIIVTVFGATIALLSFSARKVRSTEKKLEALIHSLQNPPQETKSLINCLEITTDVVGRCTERAKQRQKILSELISELIVDTRRDGDSIDKESAAEWRKLSSEQRFMIAEDLGSLDVLPSEAPEECIRLANAERTYLEIEKRLWTKAEEWVEYKESSHDSHESGEEILQRFL